MITIADEKLRAAADQLCRDLRLPAADTIVFNVDGRKVRRSLHDILKAGLQAEAERLAERPMN